MPDITMCDRQDCPLKTDCYRNPSSGTKPFEHWQSWVHFGGDDPADCENYVPKKWEALNGGEKT